jgi:hypothetical protein
MIFKAKEFDEVPRQQFRIGRTVRRMANLAAFGLDRRVLKHERSLFVSVAFDTGGIAINRVAKRLRQEPAMLIVAVGTLHAAFRNFVMKGFCKSRLLFGMTPVAQVGLRILEQKLGSLRSV